MAMIDIIMLIAISVSSLIGLFRGLVKEAMSLATWVSALFLAGVFSPQLAEVLGEFISNPPVRLFAAFALLFIGTIFVGALLSNLVSKITSAVGLGGVDRLLGAIFGILRGGLVVLILVFLMQSLDATLAWSQDSMLVPYAIEAIDYLKEIFNIEQSQIESII